MNCSNQDSLRTTHWSPPGSVGSDEVAQFRDALAAIVAQQPSDEEFALNALIDFFACRFSNTQQLQSLGAGLFAALNSEAAALITTGVFDERFEFGREQGIVRIEVDRQQLATISWDVAIRLATLLHGACRSNIGRLQAALGCAGLACKHLPTPTVAWPDVGR